MSRRATIILLIAVVALLAVWDIWAAADPEPGDTISEIVRDASHVPAVPFAMGFLCGHWFWPLKRDRSG